MAAILDIGWLTIFDLRMTYLCVNYVIKGVLSVPRSFIAFICTIQTICAA